MSKEARAEWWAKTQEIAQEEAKHHEDFVQGLVDKTVIEIKAEDIFEGPRIVFDDGSVLLIEHDCCGCCCEGYRLKDESRPDPVYPLEPARDHSVTTSLSASLRVVKGQEDER